MKQVLLTLGLLAFSLLVGCGSSPSTEEGGPCASCQAQEAVQTAVPSAPVLPCSACMKHEMLASCEDCMELGAPCCDDCATAMECAECKRTGAKCIACQVTWADCPTCAYKKYTWTQLSCTACADGEGMCAGCAELKSKLDTVSCAEHQG